MTKKKDDYFRIQISDEIMKELAPIMDEVAEYIKHHEHPAQALGDTMANLIARTDLTIIEIVGVTEMIKTWAVNNLNGEDEE